MQSLCAVFDCLSRADNKKNKSNYRFPSIPSTVFPKKWWQRKLETFESEKGKARES